MQQENSTNLIIARLKKSFNFSSNKELADLLEVKESTIRSWITRDSPDLKLIVAKCSDRDINWILTGKTQAKNASLNESQNASLNTNDGGTTETFPADAGNGCANCKILETKYFEAKDYLLAKEEEIKQLNREIGRLEAENAQLKGSTASPNKQHRSAS